MVAHVGRLGGVSTELHICHPFSACSQQWKRVGSCVVYLLCLRYFGACNITFAGLLSLRSVNDGIVPVFHVYISVIAGVGGPRVPIELSDAEC